MSPLLLPLFVLTLLCPYQIIHAQSRVVININHVVGQRNLTLATDSYETDQRESFRVTRLQYYLSNFQLVRPDGSAWVVPPDSSYFLINSSIPASQQITLSSVPPGDYAGIRFMVGVDSLRNTMPLSERKGCLDIGGAANGMYWSWNAGYVCFKLEGTSPEAPVEKTSGKNEFTFHVGQFGGMKIPTPNNTRQVYLSLQSQAIQVRPGTDARLILRADLLKVFDGLYSIRIAQHPNVMLQPVAAHLADNFSQLFSLFPKPVK